MAKPIVPAVFVVLDLPTTSVPALISRATSIVTAIGANPATFKTPSPALAGVTSHVTGLSTAEAAFKAHTGTRADRDTQFQLVIEDCNGLHAYVQALATASPSEASTIAANAGQRAPGDRKSAPRRASS